MSNIVEDGHDRGKKAAAVAQEIVRVLAKGGKLVQSSLIDQVSRALPAIGIGTVNSLTRKFLNKQRGNLVNLEQTRRPKRNYWSLTLKGLNSAYASDMIGLNELSTAFSKLLSPQNPLYVYYAALARSGKLSDRVQHDLDESDKGIELITKDLRRRSSRGLSEALKVEVEVEVVAEKITLFRTSVIRHLCNDKQCRKEVGKDMIQTICRQEMELINQTKRIHKEMEEQVRKLTKLAPA